MTFPILFPVTPLFSPPFSHPKQQHNTRTIILYRSHVWSQACPFFFQDYSHPSWLRSHSLPSQPVISTAHFHKTWYCTTNPSFGLLQCFLVTTICQRLSWGLRLSAKVLLTWVVEFNYLYRLILKNNLILLL